jgi:hypothetical protein
MIGTKRRKNENFNLIQNIKILQHCNYIGTYTLTRKVLMFIGEERLRRFLRTISCPGRVLYAAIRKMFVIYEKISLKIKSTV